MKKLIALLLALVMVLSLAACGAKEEAPATEAPKVDAPAEAPAASAEAEVLEFYHGYFHSESEWPAAKVMRDIYDEFAAQHADGPVVFKPIAVENRVEITSAQVAGGKYPDIVDLGDTIPAAAIAQGLVLDLKPFIDENGLQDAVGLNYTQNLVDGAIYTVHDQIETRGLWYNAAVLEKAGATADDLATWEGFAAAMAKVRELNDGTYGYAAGQGSFKMMVAMLATLEGGDAVLNSELTADVINSEAFATAFKAMAANDQANGSAYTTPDVGNLMADFNANGMAAVLSNGVWNASGIAAELESSIMPITFPGNVAMSSAGTGITIAAGMSDAKTELALEFLKYMVSEEVQTKIFIGMQANPCNVNVDLNALATESGDPILVKLATACAQANTAETIISDIEYVWGSDIATSIINALMECATEGTDIDARFELLQKELLALIG